jgi:hypothetical protein
VSDPAPDELVAPEWARLKSRTHDAIRMRLAAGKEWQGCRNDARSGIPAWFALPASDVARQKRQGDEDAISPKKQEKV